MGWRARYEAGGIRALENLPRSGRPREIDEIDVVVATLADEGRPPAHLGATHWSARLLAAELKIGFATVARIWRKWNLQPWRTETFNFSTDPELDAKIRDVVGLYVNPPEQAVVLCVDEKSQVQALDRSAPILPGMPTTPERMTHTYTRHGTTSLFAALDISSGSVIAAHYRRHRHQEFLRFLKTIDQAVPAELNLHLICDNYATHKTPAIHKWLLRHPRFHLHFTPTSASWLNLVERRFAELTTRKVRRSAHRSITELEADIRKWINEWNAEPKPFVWTKTADEILDNLANSCQRINASGH